MFLKLLRTKNRFILTSVYTDTKVANATPKVPILSTNINKEIIRKRDEVNVEMKASFDRLNAFIAARMIDSI